jgi:hypothetical protein
MGPLQLNRVSTGGVNHQEIKVGPVHVMTVTIIIAPEIAHQTDLTLAS